LKDDNPINDNDNVDVGVDNHFIPPLYIYDPKNWGIHDAKTSDILIRKKVY